MDLALWPTESHHAAALWLLVVAGFSQNVNEMTSVAACSRDTSSSRIVLKPPYGKLFQYKSITYPTDMPDTFVYFHECKVPHVLQCNDLSLCLTSVFIPYVHYLPLNYTQNLHLPLEAECWFDKHYATLFTSLLNKHTMLHSLVKNEVQLRAMGL